MANHPSAEKRYRQSLKRQARNRAARSSMKTAVKKARTLGEAHAPIADGEAALRAAVSVVDRTATKGIINPKTASRKISRLARAAHKASLAPAPKAHVKAHPKGQAKAQAKSQAKKR